MKKRIAGIVTALALLLGMLPAPALAAGGTVRQVSSQAEFESALSAAQAGDTIQIVGPVYLVNPASSNDPLIIDKQVTITGDELTNGYGGILLGADVTFQNITLDFPNHARNAILANGHTLTLSNVSWNQAAQKVHLFCGGITGPAYSAAEGSHGQVVISGSTSLGNIYAGSISSDGRPNSFDKPATITIEDGATGKMGDVYASGALETPDESKWFDLDQIAPPTANAEWFPVTGGVTIRLYRNVVTSVDGRTGGSRNADIEFTGGEYQNSSILLKNISGLSVKAGDLAPMAGSSFGDGAGAVSVPGGTKLDLSNFGDSADIGSFSGGGTLVLGQSQTLTISGAVTGTTAFGAGQVFAGVSDPLAAGHVYIRAPQSNENSFTLAQEPDSSPAVTLQYNSADGSWTGFSDGQAESGVIVESLDMPSEMTADSGSLGIEIPLNPEFAESDAPLLYVDFIPLTIVVNGEEARRSEEDSCYIYTTSRLKLEVAADVLYIENIDGVSPVADGVYTVTVSIPAEHTASNQELISAVTLTVGDVPDPPVVSAVAIGSTNHKISYLTGEALDVSGLTLLVAMSDGSTRTVAVTADMVSGFDSSAPAESQTLTVSYEGKTAVYTVSVAAPAPDPELYTVTVSGSYATVTGAGSYAEGDTVSISAGSRSGYTFSGWTAAGVVLSAPSSADTSFTMPSNDVTVTASWQAESGGSGTGGGNAGGSGGGSSGGSWDIPSLPVSTSGTGGSAVTTAAPDAVVSGGTASASVSDEMAAEIARQAANSGKIVIAPAISGKVTKAEVSLSAAAMGEISGGTSAALVVSTPVAKVDISRIGVEKLAQIGGAVMVTAQCQDNKAELSITAGGRPVSGLAGGGLAGGITLEVPYSNCKPGVVAVRINADGSRQVVRKSFASAGTISIPLDGSARLEIVDNSRTFADLPTADWASTAVLFASSHELFNGTSATRFSPNAPMTRGMLATVLHNLENNPDYTAEASFADVSSGAWFEDAVYWAAEKGIVSGYGNGSFGARDNVTREQLAAMLYRYAGSPETSGSLDGFTDSGKASSYAMPALRWATDQGIIAGKGGGILDPAGKATRAETAAMLMRFCEKIK